jgi:hypothetical protein
MTSVSPSAKRSTSDRGSPALVGTGTPEGTFYVLLAIVSGLVLVVLV